MAEAATFTMTRVPPSWPNRRLQWYQLAGQKKAWRGSAHILAQSARNEARWPLPGVWHLFATPRVTILLRRVRLLDHDNAYASVKPIVDGLQGALIHSDAPDKCELLVTQERVEHYADQATVVTVTRIARTNPDPVVTVTRRRRPTSQEAATLAEIEARNAEELEGSGR
jgi:hypothetical protein